MYSYIYIYILIPMHVHMEDLEKLRCYHPLQLLNGLMTMLNEFEKFTKDTLGVLEENSCFRTKLYICIYIYIFVFLILHARTRGPMDASLEEWKDDSTNGTMKCYVGAHVHMRVEELMKQNYMIFIYRYTYIYIIHIYMYIYIIHMYRGGSCASGCCTWTGIYLGIWRCYDPMLVDRLYKYIILHEAN